MNRSVTLPGLLAAGLLVVAGCENSAPVTTSAPPVPKLPGDPQTPTPAGESNPTPTSDNAASFPGILNGLQTWDRSLCDKFANEAKRRYQFPQPQPLSISYRDMEMRLSGTVVRVVPLEPGTINPRLNVYVMPSFAGSTSRRGRATGVDCKFDVNDSVAKALLPGQSVTVQGKAAMFHDKQLQSDDLLVRASAVVLMDCKLVGQ